MSNGLYFSLRIPSTMFLRASDLGIGFERRLEYGNQSGQRQHAAELRAETSHGLGRMVDVHRIIVQLEGAFQHILHATGEWFLCPIITEPCTSSYTHGSSRPNDLATGRAARWVGTARSRSRSRSHPCLRLRSRDRTPRNMEYTYVTAHC